MIRCLQYCDCKPTYTLDKLDINYLYSEEARKDVAKLCVNFAAAFEKVEKLFRKDHGLAGAEMAETTTKQHHEGFVNSRRERTRATWPYPHYYTEEAVAAWENAQLLRLLPGDRGEIAWRLGKEHVFDSLFDLIMDEVRTDNPEDPQVADLMSTFSVIV